MSEEGETLKGRCAGFVSRLMAFIVDVAVLSIGIAGATWLFNVVDDALSRIVSPVNLAPMVLGAFPIFVVLYHVFFWALSGQTPGKWLLGLRVVSRDGQRIPVRRAL